MPILSRETVYYLGMDTHEYDNTIPTYSFTELLAVIDEIGKQKPLQKVENTKDEQDLCTDIIGKELYTISQYKHKLLDAYTADGAVMNLENKEVEKFIINLIK